MILAATPKLRSSITHKHLDPASLGEVLFGLTMTLAFTLGAGLLGFFTGYRWAQPAVARGTLCPDRRVHARPHAINAGG